MNTFILTDCELLLAYVIFIILITGVGVFLYHKGYVNGFYDGGH